MLILYCKIGGKRRKARRTIKNGNNKNEGPGANKTTNTKI